MNEDTTIRATFEVEASFEDVTKGWSDDEKQLLHDGDQEACDEALAAICHLMTTAKVDVLESSIDDVR